VPELPEVEVVRRGLAPLVCGRRVTGLWCSGKPLRYPLPEPLLARIARGCLIQAIGRRGRYLILELEGGAKMLIHLGMTGRLLFLAQSAPLADHCHLRLFLDTGDEIRFHDPRRFGFVQLVLPGDPEERGPLARLGPEPFDQAFCAARLAEYAGRGKRSVKSLLMDNRVVTGIGNIYANEILFAAGIHPATPAGALSPSDWKRIALKSRSVLNRAIEAGGSTIADFRTAADSPGYFQLELAVYGREGLPCTACTTPIRKCRLSGRATFFCPTCQPEP